MTGLAARLSALISEYDAKWSALDVAGVADLWERDNPRPIYVGDEYAMPLLGADELDRHWARIGGRLKCASVSSQLWSADALAGGLARCILLSRWSFTRLESDISHTGASWITWLLTPRGEGYRIFHHMESQVYLEEGCELLSKSRVSVSVSECMDVWLAVVKLAAWARSVGVHPQTAYAWVCEDRMPVPFRRLPSGAILVDVAAAGDECVVLYARVSGHDQRGDLDRRVSGLTEWATDAGMEVGQVVAEVGSGLNGKRAKLARVLSDPCATVIVVEHWDRLARLGVEHHDGALAAHGRRIVVIDLVRGVVEVLTSMCAGLYGRRGARHRALRAVSAAQQQPLSVEAS